MQDFYLAFYKAVEHSLAHRTFCERVYGQDLCQHGFVDLEQLELLLQIIPIGRDWRVLDIGCGNGRIAEYLAGRTGAHFTGLDYIPLAVAFQKNKLAFRSWDLTHQDYALAIRRKQVLEELKPVFDAEGNLFLYNNRMGDAEGISQAIEDGLHVRYLYVVDQPSTQQN